jgi:hypothetical protein
MTGTRWPGHALAWHATMIVRFFVARGGWGTATIIGRRPHSLGAGRCGLSPFDAALCHRDCFWPVTAA